MALAFLIRTRREVMRKHSLLILAIVLLTIESLSCAQNANLKEADALAGPPTLRWKYDTGG